MSRFVFPMLLAFAVPFAPPAHAPGPERAAARPSHPSTPRQLMAQPAFTLPMRDLRGFVEARRDRLAETAVAYEVSQALEECYALSVARARDEAIVPVSAALRWPALAAGEALAAPCRGFEGHRIHPGEVLALLRYAADNGEPRARARMLLFRDVAAPKDAIVEELPALLASLDASVVRDVGAFLSRGEIEVRLGGDEVPASVAVLAWELAACDLGYECSPASRITLAQCAFVGSCGGGSYEEALDRAEPAGEMVQARRLRTGIVRALLERDWRWLGFSE